MISIINTLEQADESAKRLDETTHPSIEAGCSQCDRILSLLEEADGEWVAMPFLALKSGSFNIHSRIADLRKRGHVIEQKSERTEGSTKSFYKLNPQEA